MKILICFCAPLALFYVIHMIQFPRIMWPALCFREGDTKREIVLLSCGAWLELISFGIVVSFLIGKLS